MFPSKFKLDISKTLAKDYYEEYKFDYILPSELYIVSYNHLKQRLEILKKIVEQKILDSI